MNKIILDENRLDLAKLFKGVGVEIGVADGWYSSRVMALGQITQMCGVDPYIRHKGYMDYTRDSTFDRMRNNSHRRLEGYTNYQFLETYSMEAVKQFEDDSLDFVYIDGDHSYEAVTQDITEWLKKVKPGGIIAGDDYILSDRDKKHYDVIGAVDDFVANNNIPELFIYKAGRTPSNWMFRKPAKIAVLSCILGDFDTPIDPIEQTIPFTFHRWDDDDFPSITGLTARLQYRIPKTHGWQMLPGYDYYIWLDGAVSFKRNDCIEYYLNQLGDADMAFFKHPTRRNVRQEVAHIEEHLTLGKPYITDRYKNGLHKEQLEVMLEDPTFKDNKLWASTGFIYRNTPKVCMALENWWYYGSRYFTCDQVVLPYIIHKHELKVNTMDEPVFKSGYISLVSHHK